MLSTAVKNRVVLFQFLFYVYFNFFHL